MTCPLCLKFREEFPLVPDEDNVMEHILDWNEDGSPGVRSDPIRCAFEDSEEFSPDNWCCETMTRLRRVFDIGKWHPTWHNDSNVGVLPIPPIDDPEEKCGIQQGMLVMAWYKHRGRTGQVIILWDDDEPRKLNLKTALFVIEKMTF